MKKTYSSSWVASTQPRKQRKYRLNAPMHVRGKYLHAHLSPELRKKYGMRSLRVKVGDKVKLLRGQFKGKEVKVEKVDLTKCVIYLADVGGAKKSGEKTSYPVNPSNVMITTLVDTKSRVGKTLPAQKTQNEQSMVENKEPIKTGAKE